MTPIHIDALPASPWKNGSGLTRTIAVSPPGAGLDDFDWRVSIAEVASPAKFSHFPGVDRTILLMDGAGMILQTNDGVVPLTEPFVPYAFSGDDIVLYRLVNGATHDFNVMTRRGRARADVKVWRSESRHQVTADSAVFFCPRGTCHVDGMELGSGWALRLDRPASEINFVPQTPDSVIIA